VTGDRALLALEKALSESVNVDEKSEAYIAALADLKPAEEKVKVMLGKLPKAEREGKTTITVKVE
jgi:hypothetical protein